MSRSLFEPADERPALAARLGPRLHALAQKGVALGTSSWKYPGWVGSIYTKERYLTRGKFSKKKFDDTCLREYAETFPTVGGDFSFYQFPSAEFWAKLFAGVPPAFTFGLKVPEHVTVAQWPSHARYGKHAGTRNEHFLDAALFDQAFVNLLEPHRHHVGAMIFEFGTFPRSEFDDPTVFFEKLDRFLGALPKGWRYGVEIRNKEYLEPRYFTTLARHNVAHTYNAWTRMPTVADQFAIPESRTADFAVVRALLQKGRTYEKAVELFEPYEEIQDPDEATREALRQVVAQALKAHQRAYVFVNNRLEGSAPQTIEAVVEE